MKSTSHKWEITAALSLAILGLIGTGFVLMRQDKPVVPVATPAVEEKKPVVAEVPVAEPVAAPVAVVQNTPPVTSGPVNNNFNNTNNQGRGFQQGWRQGNVTAQQQAGPNGRNNLVLNNGNQTVQVPLPQGVQVQPTADGANLTVTTPNGRTFAVPNGIPNGRGRRGNLLQQPAPTPAPAQALPATPPGTPAANP